MSLVSYISSLASRIATEIKAIKLDVLKVALHDNLTLKGYLNSADYDIVGGVISPKTMSATTKGIVPTPPDDDTKFLNGKGLFSTPAGSGGTATGEIWTALTGTYASIYTFTFAGTDKDAALVKKSIFTCTDSAGTTRRYGFVKTAVNASGTITVTVVSTSNLAAGDKDFKVAYNQKIYPFIHHIRIPGQVTADASYSVGPWNLDLLEDMKFISSDAAAITAAAGAGAAMVWNVYSGASALYSSAPNLGTGTALRDQRPTTIDVAESANLSLRIASCGGATNYAADVQFRIYLIPTSIFTAF